MTFRRQVVWTAICGAGATAVFFAVVYLSVSRQAQTGELPIPQGAFFATLLALWISGSIFAFGALMRPLHRWLWLGSLQKAARADGTIGTTYLNGWAAPFWRWWFHVDAAGGDRDA